MTVARALNIFFASSNPLGDDESRYLPVARMKLSAIKV
jgi:hypothetical protein